VSGPSLRELWEACGGIGELRLLIEHRSQPARGVVIPTPFAVVGSGDACEVLLLDNQISYRHAYLQVIAGQLWRFDLLSRTGTFWKQRRESVGLFDGSEALRVGPYELQTLIRENVAPGAANPLLATPPEQDPLPTVTLEFPNAAVMKGRAQLPTWQLDRVITYVGQSQLCKVCLKCPSVSRIHCSLLRTPQGVWVIDLLGREGVSINDTRVRWARLRDGDRLKVGRFEMYIHEEPRRASTRTSHTNLLGVNKQLANGPGVVPVPVPRSLQIGGEAPAGALSSALTTSAKSGVISPLSWPASVQAPSPAPVQPGTVATDATQALVLTFVNQFSMMQQQMFDQFQQTTVMMLQMFSTLQRDQFDLIRQELDGLRDLNREMHSLQTELANYRAAPADALRSIQQNPATSITDSGSAPSLAAAAPGSRQAHRATQISANRADAPDTPARKKSKVAASHATTEPIRTDQDVTRPVQSPGQGLETPAQPVNGSSPESTGPPSEDVHAWLSQRFTDLQQERQSRWQKIVGTLLGK